MKSVGQTHRKIDAQLSATIEQLQRQADSMFDGKSWNAASYAEFGDCLIRHGKRLVALGENFNSRKPPQWYLDQQAAYEKSAIGRLRHNATDNK